MWTEAHDNALSTVKNLICTAPVLCYFDPASEITLQCDASDGGLGYALLQLGQPVAYGARGLTVAEKICTDREGDAGHSLWMQKVWSILIWSQSDCGN